MSEHKLSHITDLVQLSDEAVATFAKDLPTLIAALRLANQAAIANGTPLKEAFPVISFDSASGDKVILKNSGQYVTEFNGGQVRAAQKIASSLEVGNNNSKNAPKEPGAPLAQQSPTELTEWHRRLFSGLMEQLGEVAPKPATLPHAKLGIRLLLAIEATRADRIEFLSPGLREMLQDMYYQCEYKSDTTPYNEKWLKDAVIKNGVRPLSDDTDANLLSRVIVSIPWDKLRDKLFPSSRVTSHCEEFMAIMNTTLAASLFARHQKNGYAHKAATFIDGVDKDLELLGWLNPFRPINANSEEFPDNKSTFH
jgi:hypothetical protein